MVALLLFAVVAAAALAVCALLWREETRPGRAYALLYHRLVSPEEYASFPPLARNFSIPEPRFRAQLEHLRRAGYVPIALDDLVAALEQRRALPERSLLVSFDDGCQSVHARALPILRELGFPAVCFVTTDADSWVFRNGPDAQRRLTPDEIRELERSGVEIGSHALSHDALQAMSAAQIDRELHDSKRWLEAVTGKPVRYFGVPLNWYGRKVRESAIRLGYRAVCTSDAGSIHAGSDPFHLRRMSVEGWMTPSDLEASLQPAAVVQRRLIAFAKRFPARLVGPALWLPFRRWLFASPLGPLLSLRNLRRLLIGGTVGALALVLALAAWLAGRT